MKLTLVIILVVLISGCGGPGTTVHRGSLSEAVEKSNNDFKGERKIENTTKEENNSGWCFFCLFEDDNENEIKSSSSVGAQSEDPPSREITGEWAEDWLGEHYWGIKALTSARFSRNFKNSAGFGVSGTFRGENKGHEIDFQMETFTTKVNSRFYGSTSNPFNLSIGYHRLRFLTPWHTLLGLCIKDGFNLNTSFWAYNNALHTDVFDEDDNFLYTETIKYDGIFSFNADIGLGLQVLQHKSAGLSISLLGGATVYWFKTYRSLDNDLLHPEGYVKVTVDLLVKGKRE